MKNLRKVVVKASPSRKNVINIDDLMDNNNVNLNNNENFSGQNLNVEPVNIQIPQTEEEKSKALEDFLS